MSHGSAQFRSISIVTRGDFVSLLGPSGYGNWAEMCMQAGAARDRPGVMIKPRAAPE